MFDVTEQFPRGPHPKLNPNDVVPQLLALKRGQSTTYHIGYHMGECPTPTWEAVTRLIQEGQITSVQKRHTDPVLPSGKVDRNHGVGTFEYIAQGLKN